MLNEKDLDLIERMMREHFKNEVLAQAAKKADNEPWGKKDTWIVVAAIENRIEAEKHFDVDDVKVIHSYILGVLSKQPDLISNIIKNAKEAKKQEEVDKRLEAEESANIAANLFILEQTGKLRNKLISLRDQRGGVLGKGRIGGLFSRGKLNQATTQKLLKKLLNMLEDIRPGLTALGIQNSGASIDKEKILAKIWRSVANAQETQALLDATGTERDRFLKLFPSGKIPEISSEVSVRKDIPRKPAASTPPLDRMTSMREQATRAAQTVKSSDLGKRAAKLAASVKKRITESETWKTIITRMPQTEREALKKTVDAYALMLEDTLNKQLKSGEDKAAVDQLMTQFKTDLRTKVLGYSLDPEHLSSLEKEIRETATAKHELVKTLYEAMEENSPTYLHQVKLSLAESGLSVATIEAAEQAAEKVFSAKSKAATKPAVTFSSSTSSTSSTPSASSTTKPAATVTANAELDNESKKLLGKVNEKLADYRDQSKFKIKPTQEKDISKGGGVLHRSNLQQKFDLSADAHKILAKLNSDKKDVIIDSVDLISINNMIMANDKATGHTDLPLIGSKLAGILNDMLKLVKAKLANNPEARLEAYAVLAQAKAANTKRTGIASIRTDQSKKYDIADQVLKAVNSNDEGAKIGIYIKALQENDDVTVKTPGKGRGELDGIIRELLLKAVGGEDHRAKFEDELKKAGLPVDKVKAKKGM